MQGCLLRDQRPPEEIVHVQSILGEGIVWDSGRTCLWWTDIQSRRLYRYDWASGSLRVVDTPERVGSFGLVAGSEQLIAAFANGIGFFDVQRQLVTWLDRPASVGPGMRFNDGKVDRRGRFWAGTMLEVDSDRADACLYSIETGGKARRHLQNLKITNGLCFSPDGSKLYVADSPTRQIDVYDLQEPDGILGERRAFAHTPEGAYPDGAAVDVDGCIWSAHWGAGCVVRYTPDGKVDRTLEVPVSQPTCVCFAGRQLDVLCVTTAREGLDGATLIREPHAGDVLMYRMGVQGLPEPEYRV